MTEVRKCSVCEKFTVDLRPLGTGGFTCGICRGLDRVRGVCLRLPEGAQGNISSLISSLECTSLECKLRDLRHFGGSQAILHRNPRLVSVGPMFARCPGDLPNPENLLKLSLALQILCAIVVRTLLQALARGNGRSRIKARRGGPGRTRGSNKPACATSITSGTASTGLARSPKWSDTKAGPAILWSFL